MLMDSKPQSTYRRQKLSNLLKLAIRTSPPEHALREKKTCVAASLQTCIQILYEKKDFYIGIFTWFYNFEGLASQYTDSCFGFELLYTG